MRCRRRVRCACRWLSCSSTSVSRCVVLNCSTTSVHTATVCQEQLPLMVCVTAGNEALHAELKVAFRQTTRLHQAILATKLCVIRVGKILSHAGVYVPPTTRQMTQGMVLSRMLGKGFLSEDAWSRICRHATKSPLPKETTDLQTWHKYNVKKVRAFLILQTRQKPRRKHRTVFSVVHDCVDRAREDVCYSFVKKSGGCWCLCFCIERPKSRVFPVTFKTVETHFSLCLKSSDHRHIGPRESVGTSTCYGLDLQQGQETIFVISQIRKCGVKLGKAK